MNNLPNNLWNILTILANVRNKLSSISLLVLMQLVIGCQSTEVNEKPTRKTLADVAQAQEKVEIERVRLSREQRANKLKALYQTLLTLEPDPEVKAQIEYRIVQMNTEAYEAIDDEAFVNEETLKASEQTLAELIVSYQTLIERFPNRKDNEWMRYQLAKALDLQGKPEESLQEMEMLLSIYPQSRYKEELHFRRGDIYYSFQEYNKSLLAYQSASQQEKNNQYYVNSRYMAAWVLFKLNRLPEADVEFISLLDYLVNKESLSIHKSDFTFEQLDNRYASLVKDVQRVLSISLSQQAQSESLVALTKQQATLPSLPVYQHILFNNLAVFLIENELKYDAELTYQSYIDMAPNTIWAARYSIALLELLKQQGKYSASRKLQQRYVKQFGIDSAFWLKAKEAKNADALTMSHISDEVIPNLLAFSYQHARREYAQAQRIKAGKKRENAFIYVSKTLATYLAIAKHPRANYIQNKPKQSKSLLADELLYADANFEAKQYQNALEAYQQIAYGQVHQVKLGVEPSDNYLNLSNIQPKKQINNNNLGESKKSAAKIALEAAYATTLTTRKMLSQAQVKTTDTVVSQNLTSKQKQLLVTRNHLDQVFIATYPEDPRVLNLATQAAQYAYNSKDYQAVAYFSDFILKRHVTGFDETTFVETQGVAKRSKGKSAIKLSGSALKQSQIVSQLQANSYYQQKQYVNAENAYEIALLFVENSRQSLPKKERKKRQELRELIASCIYFQGQHYVKTEPLKAVEQYLRIGKRIPESSYRINAEFDAGNILLAEQQWQRGIDVLASFKRRYPNHKYSRTIAAKLAKAYENTGQWEFAATQLLAMINGPEAAKYSDDLKREALYTAAEYYQKSGNKQKTLTTYRTYAHSYPEPFVIAQEVRLKLSDFYKQTKETNKQYFWYRKIVKYHDLQVKKKPQSIDARTEYLASFAAIGLGKAHQQTFTWTKLTLPLNKSLKKKQSAMKEAIKYYQKVLSYQLAEFVPQASYNLAKMYSVLASDILTSERPKDLDELALEEYDFVLEDIAYPFEEKAIEIHTNNAQRAWQDVYDEWVANSFSELAELDPSQYNKKERASNAVATIY